MERFTFSNVTFIGTEILDKKGELKIYPDGDLLIVNEGGSAEMLERINKEIAETEKEIARCEGMLNNPNFVNKAPAEKVNLEKEKLAKHKESLETLLNKKKQLS